MFHTHHMFISLTVVPQNFPSHSSRPFSQGFSRFKLAQVLWNFPVPKLKGNCQKGRKQIKIWFWQNLEKYKCSSFQLLRLAFWPLLMQAWLASFDWAWASGTFWFGFTRKKSSCNLFHFQGKRLSFSILRFALFVPYMPLSNLNILSSYMHLSFGHVGSLYTSFVWT